MQTQTESILTSYSSHEKAAYLGALAALATADRSAEEDELTHLREIADAAGISPDEQTTIFEAAKDPSGQNLKSNLDTLKNSDMRFSLITDLIAVAKADGAYSEEEKKNIERVSNYLNINHDQFAVLDEAVTKASGSEEAVQQIDKPNFIQSLGMQNQFSNAGFNMGSIGKSLFGFLGPMVLGGMAAKALGGRRTPGGGGLGGSLGGGLGGMLGGMLGSGAMSRGLPGGLGGGLGSLISGLNRSRGSRGMGGLLGRIL